MKKVLYVIICVICLFITACRQNVQFSIYFDSKGGSEVSSISTGGNSAVVIPTNPTKEGFEFDGWYWDNNTFNRPFTANSLLEEPISSNMTVYAKWTSSEGEDFGIVTATGFELDGTNMYIEVSNTTTTYSFIGQITVSPSATWDLYNDILGENRIATKTISLSIGDNTVYILVTKDDEIKLYTVTVRRLPIYEVSFNTDGGSLLESQFIQEDDMLQEPTTIKSGYTLIGWEDNNNEVTFPIEIEEDMLIKAKWEVNQNTLSFDSNGGVGEMGSVLVETNETTALPKNTFTRIDYTFVGWSTSEIGEVEYLDEANYTMGTLASYTLYAKWAINSYTLELTRSNALAGSVTGSGIKEYNSEVTITATTNPGYTFIGWYNDEDLVSSLATYTFNMPASDLSYEAKWEVNQNTLSFDSNGGVGEMGSVLVETNETINLPKNIITKTGYAFIGWSTSIEGSVVYLDEANYTMGTLASYTLYAKWEKPSTEGLMFELKRDNTYEVIGYQGISTEIIIEHTYRGKTITSIGAFAFRGCSSLTSITIPSSVTSIGNEAFSGCSSLIELTLPFVGASRTATGTSALFGHIFGTTSYTGGSSTKQYYASGSSSTYYIPTSLKTVIITDATTLGYGVFYGCSSLTSITIPSSVTSIGTYAFYGCSSLTSITIPNSVTSIGNSAFRGCSSLTSITIPSSVTSIGNWAFEGCSSLTSITIPNSVTSIGVFAFSGCSGLTSIIIPEGVTSIAYGAFYRCSSLTSITIPSSVTSIGDLAFEGCSSLTSIIIPEGVTSIGTYAFRDCSRLTIYAEASSKPAGWNSSWNYDNRPVVWGYTGE